VLQPLHELDVGDLSALYGRHRTYVGGGYLAGAAAAVRRLCRDFRQLMREALALHRAPLEEQVLALLLRQQPDAFDVYCGTFREILSNYHAPRASLPVIVAFQRACREARDFARGCEVGAAVLAAHQRDQLTAAPADLQASLYEYFTAAYAHDFPDRKRATAILDRYAELVRNVPAFRHAHEERHGPTLTG